MIHINDVGNIRVRFLSRKEKSRSLLVTSNMQSVNSSQVVLVDDRSNQKPRVLKRQFPFSNCNCENGNNNETKRKVVFTMENQKNERNSLDNIDHDNELVDWAIYDCENSRSI